MPKFMITYEASEGREPEEIEADTYVDDGEWIDFVNADESRTRVLRVRTSEVGRVEATD